MFPLIRLEGKQPISPDTVLMKIIRPALIRAGVKDKAIGWHSFRHSLATNLRAAGVDLKTAQELLRHANSRITLDVYTRAISATEREANNRVMDMVFEAERSNFQHPRRAEPHATKEALRPLAPSLAPSELVCHFLVSTKSFIFLGLVAGTTGLEPETSAVTVRPIVVTY